jgi:hypothetical protein
MRLYGPVSTTRWSGWMVTTILKNRPSSWIAQSRRATPQMIIAAPMMTGTGPPAILAESTLWPQPASAAPAPMLPTTNGRVQSKGFSDALAPAVGAQRLEMGLHP